MPHGFEAPAKRSVRANDSCCRSTWLLGDGVVFRYPHVVVVHVHALRAGRGHVRVPQRNHRQILDQYLLALLVDADGFIEVGLFGGLIDERVESRAFVIAVVQALAVGGGGIISLHQIAFRMRIIGGHA